MEEIISELASPKWWVSVVVAGIVINLVAAYIKPSFDKVFSSFSSWWRNRTNSKNEEREKYIKKLSNDPHLQVMESLDELRQRNRSVYALVLGIFIASTLPRFN